MEIKAPTFPESIADGSVAQVAEVSCGVDIRIGINFGRRQGRDGSGWDEQSIHVSQGIYGLDPQVPPGYIVL